MSYEEYNDLFAKAQKNKKAEYLAFIFDIKNSKLMDKKTRRLAQIKSFNTFNLMIKYFKVLEEKSETKILVEDLPVLKVNNITKPKNKFLNYLNNPCVAFGDSFAFYCYNGAISSREFENIFKYCARICNNKTEYHITFGKFETLSYNEANSKYYIGYIVEKLAKDKTKIEEDIL